MIYGIGLDVIELARMTTAWSRFRERLANRILHPEEWRDFRICANPEVFLAKRWVAKEAVAKAFGSGLSGGLYMRNMCISHSRKGQPQVQLSGSGANWLQSHNACCHLSLSDERNMVCAVAVLAAGQASSIES